MGMGWTIGCVNLGVRFNRLRAMLGAVPGAMVRAILAVYSDTGEEVGVPPSIALKFF